MDELRHIGGLILHRKKKIFENLNVVIHVYCITYDQIY